MAAAGVRKQTGRGANDHRHHRDTVLGALVSNRDNLASHGGIDASG